VTTANALTATATNKTPNQATALRRTISHL
jgi:hypothetical protein